LKKVILLPLFICLFLVNCKKPKDGEKALIDLIIEQKGTNCPNGGYKVLTGLDLNDDNTLQENEIQNIKYICNGLDGKTTLMSVVNEPAGTNCATGGYKINSGVDMNSNGTLEGVEIANSQYVCNGLPGSNSLVSITTESAGLNCPTGGYKLNSGTDLNKDGVLDASEITSSKFICNGLTGSNSLVSLLTEPAGANCSTGGYKLNTGIDLNNNNTLDLAEITNSQYLCNGLTGSNSLISVVAEPAGVNCANGGYKVNTGVDVNKNGTLESIEVQSSKYICNGVNGLHYLVGVVVEPSGPTCIFGGYRFNTGLDLNNNRVLENNEIMKSDFICNNAALNELRIPIDFYANTTSTTGVQGLAIFNFNKANYSGMDSIVFVSKPYSGDLANNSIVDLINKTDNTVISGSQLISNKSGSDAVYLTSINLFNALPNKTIDINLRVRSEFSGKFAGNLYTSYLILYPKK
jgi:hypothetical protein